jgi:peptide/nickel transport system substrate-binding protein
VPSATPYDEPPTLQPAEPAPTDRDDIDDSASRLVVGIDPPLELDPALATTTGEIALGNAIYNRLVNTNAEGELLPSLATRWRALEGGLIYDIELVEDATFHNGNPVTSADVVWSLNRLRDPDLGIPRSDLLASVSSVEAIGDNRLLVVLSRPDTEFMYELADHRAAIVRYGTADPRITLNGTGPFAIDSAAAGQFAILAANDGYHVAGRPVEDRLEFEFLEAPVYALRAFLAGNVDIILELPAQECEQLEGATGITIVYHESLFGKPPTCSAIHDYVSGFVPHLIPGLTDLSGVSVTR